MICIDDIEDISGRIAEAFAPDRIILFGSYAYGAPTDDSDVDMLVVMDFDGSGVDKAVEIMDKIAPRIPVEIVVRSRAEIERRLLLNDFFLKEIMEKGKTLYESAHI